MLESITAHTVQYIKPEHPKEIPGVTKSSRVNFRQKKYYIPSIKGFKYAVAVAQLEYCGALHPDADILFTKMQEE